MKLTQKSIVGLLADIRSPQPTPGGGSVSALGGALAAALLTMVASMLKHRARSDEELQRLQASGRRCADLCDQLTRLVDEDSAAYDLVLAAYRLPKSSDAEQVARSARIQDALKCAIQTPLDVMDRCAATAEAAVVVAAFGNPSASSDIGVALEFLEAAQRGARLNVDINLASIKDASYADDIRQQVAALAAACEDGILAARGRLAEA